MNRHLPNQPCMSWLLQECHTTVTFPRPFSKTHFACKSGFYPPGLNTIRDVFLTFPCKLSSQQLYRHQGEVLFCTTDINNNLLSSLIQHYYIHKICLWSKHNIPITILPLIIATYTSSIAEKQVLRPPPPRGFKLLLLQDGSVTAAGSPFL